MSKYQNGNADHDDGTLKPNFAEEAKCENAWIAMCAKLGLPDAAHVRGGGSKAELHKQRNTMRRAANKVNESIGVRDMTNEEFDAMKHCGHVVAKIESLIDMMENHESRDRGTNSRQPKQMRTAEDFRAHYRSKGQESEEGIDLGDFIRGVANMPTTPAVRAALSEGTNSAGGFTLPNVVMPSILSALVPNSSLLQAGMPIIPLVEGAKNYTTAIVSGVPTAAWRLENGNVVESDPVFSGVVAQPQSLSFFFKISRELLADAPNVQQALLVAIGQAMAKALDLAGLRGTGTAPQPRGILNTVGIQSVTNGANGAALAGYANLLSAVQAMLNADAPMPTAAIMAPRSLVKLGGLVDTTNQPLNRPPMLKDLPFIATSQIPTNLTVGTSTDCSEIYLGDFTKMAMMLRENLSVQLLSELYAGAGQLAFMCHCRADFAVMYPSAFTVVTGVRA